MTKIIAFHSFRRGAGTSNILASCATLIAAKGLNVGVIDTDLQSPSAHILFGLPEHSLEQTMNDYLWNTCSIQDATYEVTPPGVTGKLFLVPGSPNISYIMRILREGYEIDRLNQGFSELTKNFKLDFLFVDTSAGLSEETLVSMAICDTLMLLLRLDKQDYQGTAIVISLAQRLDIPRMNLIINHVSNSFDPEVVRHEVQDKYQLPVAAVFPHSDEMQTLASGKIFALEYPDHPLNKKIKALVESFMKL